MSKRCPTIETLARALVEATRAARKRLDDELKGFSPRLSQARWAVLAEISRADGERLTQNALACRLGIETATLVGLLNGLSKAGWVVRRPSSLDRRANVLELTVAGQALIRNVTPMVKRFRRSLFSGLPAEDLQSASRVFAAIQKNAKKEDAPSGVLFDH